MRAVLLFASLLVVGSLAAAPVPKNLKGSGTIFIWSNTQPPVLNLYTPDGEHIKQVTFDGAKDLHIEGISPDGRRAVVFEPYQAPKELTVLGVGFRTRVYLIELDRADEKPSDPVADGWEPCVVWSHDGTTGFVSCFTQNPLSWKASDSQTVIPAEVFEVDATSGEKKRTVSDHGHRIHAVAPDGREFLVGQCEQGGFSLAVFLLVALPWEAASTR